MFPVTRIATPVNFKLFILHFILLDQQHHWLICSMNKVIQLRIYSLHGHISPRKLEKAVLTVFHKISATSLW